MLFDGITDGLSPACVFLLYIAVGGNWRRHLLCKEVQKWTDVKTVRSDNVNIVTGNRLVNSNPVYTSVCVVFSVRQHLLGGTLTSPVYWIDQL